MKRLKVAIKLEMTVPDDWELVQTDGGSQLLRLPDKQLVGLTFEPLFSGHPEEVWTSAGRVEVLNDLLDRVGNEQVSFEVVKD